MERSPELIIRVELSKRVMASSMYMGNGMGVTLEVILLDISIHRVEKGNFRKTVCLLRCNNFLFL